MEASPGRAVRPVRLDLREVPACPVPPERLAGSGLPDRLELLVRLDRRGPVEVLGHAEELALSGLLVRRVLLDRVDRLVPVELVVCLERLVILGRRDQSVLLEVREVRGYLVVLEKLVDRVTLVTRVYLDHRGGQVFQVGLTFFYSYTLQYPANVPSN